MFSWHMSIQVRFRGELTVALITLKFFWWFSMISVIVILQSAAPCEAYSTGLIIERFVITMYVHVVLQSILILHIFLILIVKHKKQVRENDISEERFMWLHSWQAVWRIWWCFLWSLNIVWQKLHFFFILANLILGGHNLL